MSSTTRRARRVTPRLLLLVLALALALASAACGSDGDSDDATPAATTGAMTATTASGGASDAASPSAANEQTAQATATEADAEEPAATPAEAEATATATDEASATSPVGVPDATPTAAGDEPTATSIATTEIEQQLLDALLTAADVPDGWLVDDPEIVEPDSVDGEELCGAEPFPGEAESLAQAQVSFGDEAQSIFVLHKLIAYPDAEIAAEAIAWQQDAFVCPDWSDPDGFITSVTPVDLTLEGVDEVATADATAIIPGNATALAGRWIYARIGQVVLVFARIHEPERDNADLDAALALAIERAAALDTVLQTD